MQSDLIPNELIFTYNNSEVGETRCNEVDKAGIQSMIKQTGKKVDYDDNDDDDHDEK